MPREIFEKAIFIYAIINIILFTVYKFTMKNKIMHRILSIINTIGLCLLLGYGFYKIQPLFVIFVPIVFLIELPISWGLNKELTDEEASSLEITKGFAPLNEKKLKMKVEFIHFVTFPFFYLLDSWSKA